MAEPRIGAKMTMDVTRFQAGLRAASMAATETAGRMKSAFAGVAGMFGVSLTGLVTGGGIIAGLKRVSAELSQLKDIADRSGTSFEAFQKLAQYFRENGVDAGEFGDSLAKMTMRVAEAKAGNEGLLEALDTLGIKIEELDGLAPDEMFLRFSEAIKESGNSAEAMAASTKFFEETFRKLREGMSEGGDEIKKNMADISAVTSAQVNQIKEAEAAWMRLGQSIVVATGRGLSEILKLWEATAEWRASLGTTEAPKEFRKFMSNQFGEGFRRQQEIAATDVSMQSMRRAFGELVGQYNVTTDRGQQLELSAAIDALRAEMGRLASSIVSLGGQEPEMSPIGEGF